MSALPDQALSLGKAFHIMSGLGWGEALLGQQLFDSFLPCKLLTPLFFFSSWEQLMFLPAKLVASVD